MLLDFIDLSRLFFYSTTNPQIVAIKSKKLRLIAFKAIY